MRTTGCCSQSLQIHPSPAEAAKRSIPRRSFIAEGILHLSCLKGNRQGVLGISGATAVYDQIVTEPRYGRRGLGSAIMGALGGVAALRGISDCLLVATAEGRALYQRLGWELRSDIVSIISPQE